MQSLTKNTSKPVKSRIDLSVKQATGLKEQKILPPNLKLNKKSIKLKKRPNENLTSVPFTPKPYRVTIKLSGANPSAPAEALTKALRKAGMNFEVEKIERFKKSPLYNDLKKR